MVARFPATVLATQRIDDSLLRLSVRAVGKFPVSQPGQFFQLAIDRFDEASYWPESRAYSVFSVDGMGDFQFLISRSGNFSERVWKEVLPENSIWLKGPYGELGLELGQVEKGADVVFVAAGSGISPFRSLIEAFLANGTTGYGKATLLYSVKYASSLVGADDLVKLSRIYAARLNLLFFITRDSRFPAGLVSFGRRIKLEDVLNSVRGSHNTHFFLSGPRELVLGIVAGLTGAGISDQKIHFDDWG